MDKVDIIVIGAGVVGLAIASKLSKKYPSLIVAEKNSSFGQETSSRNSEVIHSGIYYPFNSLKHKLCVQGNGLLYAYLAEKGIKHKAIGKIVVASNEEERFGLLKLKSNGERNGVKNLRIIEKNELSQMAPGITGACALVVPSTGIVDSHELMKSLLNDCKLNGSSIAYNSEVSRICKLSSGFRVTVKNDSYEFDAKYIINCAGLFSDNIAGLCGIDIDKASYKLKYCKGDYFRAIKPFNVEMLVYPVPEAEIHSLGIHLTPDLGGGLRLGPDAEYVENVYYTVDETKKHQFAGAVNSFLPGLTVNDIVPDTSGIRPKLQGPNDSFRDFVIREESLRGLPGLVNLIGIESPGLTSCLAIAEYVEGLL